MGEDEAVILGQVNEAIARAQETHPGLKARCYLAEGEEKCWTGDTIRARRYFPAWVTEEDSELVQAALKGLKDAGIEAPLSHFSFCTNGSSFCGEAGIPSATVLRSKALHMCATSILRSISCSSPARASSPFSRS